VSFRVVIPARYGATRLPGKPLRLIAGRPMLQHVYERATESGAESVWVATDDERIAEACRRFGARVVLTSANHPSGTDRIAEVARHQRWPDDAIIVNVQGDEPLLPPANVNQVAELLAGIPAASLATLATPVLHVTEYLDPNVVKVVRDSAKRALYFSRAGIPWHSAHAAGGPDSVGEWRGALRHIGLYAYRCGVLQGLAALAPSALEQSERLEQLRALEHGLFIAVDIASTAPGPGVDTEADLAAVERRFTLENI